MRHADQQTRHSAEAPRCNAEPAAECDVLRLGLGRCAKLLPVTGVTEPAVHGRHAEFQWVGHTKLATEVAVGREW